MGLFSSKTIINVASTLYNLAGPEEDRPNFLKTNLFGAIMSPHERYIGETISGSYLKGPGIKQRQFFNWAKNRSIAGMPVESLNRQQSINAAIVEPHIPVPGSPAGLQVRVQTSEITDSSLELFVERWLLDNRPEKYRDEWIADYDPDTQLVTIQYPDNTTDSFTETEFSTDDRYVAALYLLIRPVEEKPVSEGTMNTDVLPENLPDLTDYVQESLSDETTDSFDLNRDTHVLVEYSDGRPNEESTSSEVVSESWTNTLEVLKRSEYQGTYDPETGSTSTLDYYFNLWHRKQVETGYYDQQVVTEDIGGGVTKTTTTTVTGEQLTSIYDHREDTQQLIESAAEGGQKLFLYKLKTNTIPELEALDEEVPLSEYYEFYPFIPIRLNNRSITDPVYETNGLYEESSLAYKKATDGKNFSQIIDIVEDNESLSDIDYAYVCYGVSLNVLDHSCRLYLYEFFKSLMVYQTTTEADFDDFVSSIENLSQALSAYWSWEQAQADGQKNHPLHGTPRPDYPQPVRPPSTTLRLNAVDSRVRSFDMRITWVNISETQETGVYTPSGGNPLKKGEVIVQKGPTYSWSETIQKRNSDGEYDVPITRTLDSIEIIHQQGSNTYRKLKVSGLAHQNYIYGGKAVTITAHQALDDDEPSGFLVPLHYPTVRSLSLVHSTQMATANTHILFNCYTVTKQKWYQRGIFKLFIVVLVIVVSVAINPGAFASLGGILGGNLAVGTALGLSGTAAIMAGAVANALAAMIVTQVISGVATELFGAKLGALIAAIASFVTMSGFSSGFTGGFDWAALSSASGIMNLTNVLANGYAGWTQANIAEIYDQMGVDRQKYEQEMDRINKLISELGGQNDLNFNPMFLTDTVQGNGSQTSSGYLPESMDEFIRRTTLVGSDIVEITHNMIYDYTNLSLTLPEN